MINVFVNAGAWLASEAGKKVVKIVIEGVATGIIAGIVEDVTVNVIHKARKGIQKKDEGVIFEVFQERDDEKEKIKEDFEQMARNAEEVKKNAEKVRKSIFKKKEVTT